MVYVSESWSEDEDERSDSWGGDGVYRSQPYTTLDMTKAMQGVSSTASNVFAIQLMGGNFRDIKSILRPYGLFRLTMWLKDGTSHSIASDGTWSGFNADVERNPGPGPIPETYKRMQTPFLMEVCLAVLTSGWAFAEPVANGIAVGGPDGMRSADLLFALVKLDEFFTSFAVAEDPGAGIDPSSVSQKS